MRLIITIFILTCFSLHLKAPPFKVAYLTTPEKLMPYDALIKAVVTIESGNNNLAYNESEKAVGSFQIREIRLTDFNNRTGKGYTHVQCYDYEISKEIFLWYACQIGPGNIELICRKWNGKISLTDDYWRKVQKHLDISQ